MGLYLVNSDGTNLRLASGSDGTEAARALDDAFREQTSVSVQAEMNDDPLQVMAVRVYPRALGWWALVEIDEETNRVSRTF